MMDISDGQYRQNSLTPQDTATFYALILGFLPCQKSKGAMIGGQ